MKYLQIFGTWKYFNLETTSVRSAVVSLANSCCDQYLLFYWLPPTICVHRNSVDGKFFLDFPDIVIDIFFCIDCSRSPAGASIAQWQSVGLVNQRSWVQSSLEASFLDKSVTVRMWEKDFDPDVIRTRSLLIWSQTRYRCATESSCVRSYRDLNSDRWIQSPEC